MLGYQPRYDAPSRYDAPVLAGTSILGKDIATYHYGANRQVVGAVAVDGTELVRDAVGNWSVKHYLTAAEVAGVITGATA